MQTIAAGRASLITATNPMFIALLCAFFFRERLYRQTITGIFLGLAGAAIVISRGDLLNLLAGGVGWGEIYIGGTMASWIAYTLIGRVILKDMSPLPAVTYSCLIGAIALFPLAILENMAGLIKDFYPVDWTCLLFLGFFGTVLGFFWYYEGIKAIGPSRAAVFINFVPVSGVFFGWLLLDEPIDLTLLAGAILIIAGVYLTNRPVGAHTPSCPGEECTKGI